MSRTTFGRPEARWQSSSRSKRMNGATFGSLEPTGIQTRGDPA